MEFDLAAELFNLPLLLFLQGQW